MKYSEGAANSGTGIEAERPEQPEGPWTREITSDFNKSRLRLHLHIIGPTLDTAVPFYGRRGNSALLRLVLV